MTYTYNYTDSLIETVMRGIKDPAKAFPTSDGWTPINTTEDLAEFMNDNPDREYFIVWSSPEQLTFDYVHPKTSPIIDIDVESGKFTVNWVPTFLDTFTSEGGSVFIKTGEIIKPDLPENPTDKIYNVVVATSDTDYDDPYNEVVLVEAVRLIDGTWSGYTSDGHPYININHAYIKNFQIDPPRK